MIDKCKALLHQKTISSLKGSIPYRQSKNLLHNTQQSSSGALVLLKDYQKTSIFLKTGTISMSLPSRLTRMIRNIFWERGHSVKCSEDSAKYKKIRRPPSKLCTSKTKVVSYICRKTQWIPKLSPSSAVAQVRRNCGYIHD